MSLPAHRSPGDAATVEGPTPSPQRVEPAASSSWQPLPRSFLRRRQVTPPEAADPDPRRTERMTWPPARPRGHGLGLGGRSGALASDGQPRGWVGSPSVPPRRAAGADANAPPSSAARVPHSPRSVGPPASSTPASTARVPPSQRSVGPSARQAQHQASAASPLGSAPPPRPALATSGGGAAPNKAPTIRSGARRPPMPTIKPSTGTPGPGAPSPRRWKRKPPTGSPGASAPRPRPKTRKPPTAGSPGALPPPHTTEAITDALPAPRINLPPSPRLRLAASGHGTIEVLFNLNYGHLGYTGLVLLGLYAGLKDQMSGWRVVSKIIYLVLMILGASSLGAGLMAASSVAPTSYTRRVSSVCSRLCTCLATFVFVVALACQMGSHGYIAGVVLGAAAVGYMLSVWVEGDPDAYDSFSWVRTAVKHLWQWFKWSARRGPLLP